MTSDNGWDGYLECRSKGMFPFCLLPFRLLSFGLLPFRLLLLRISYFEERWLNGPYPLKTWNYYQMEGPKTNNHVEGWHNKINRAAGKAHPNIFELVELFKTEVPHKTEETCLEEYIDGISKWMGFSM